MKKVLSLLLIVISLFTLASCSLNGKIKNVTVNNSKHETIYLYAFKDAEFVEYKAVTSNESDKTPSSTGYIYSTEKLSVGDKITVWMEFYFDENIKYSLSRASGVDAVVSKVVDTYHVEVSQQENTYIITYFNIDSVPSSQLSYQLSYTSETEKENLKKLTKNKIQVSIENVIITYDVD